jgi:hypothetical protein
MMAIGSVLVRSTASILALAFFNVRRVFFDIDSLSVFPLSVIILITFRVAAKNNFAGLRRDWVHLQGALKFAYRDMWPSMRLADGPKTKQDGAIIFFCGPYIVGLPHSCIKNMAKMLEILLVSIESTT